MVASTLSVKRGASLQLLFVAKNDDGTAYDLTGITVTAEVRDIYGHLVASLTVVKTGGTGLFNVAQATDGWPTGSLSCDLKFVQGGVVLKSSTFHIQVNESVTA